MAIRQVTSRSIKDGEIITADIATQTGNVDFADNGRIRFGNSQDLQIYHDGSNSFVVDNGTGGLQLRGSTFVALQGTNGENGVLVTENGSAQLRFNNSPKLETTGSGATVTGTVTADGLISDSITNESGNLLIASTQSVTLRFDSDNNQTNREFNLQRNAATGIFKAEESGDITFFADNGTTQGLRWDASTQRLGLGTTSPSTNLEINGGANNNIVRIVSTDANANIEFADNTTTSGLSIGANGNNMKFGISGTEAMRITSGGTLAIATTSPESQAKLQANGPAIFIHNHTDTSSSGNVSYLAGNQALTLVNAQAGANNRCVKLGFSVPTLGANSDGLIEYGSTAAGSGEFRFYTESGNTLANRMTLDSNGRIGLNRAATSGFRQSILSNGAVEYQLLCQTSNTSGTQYHIAFYRDGTSAGYITTTASNTVSLNSGSDYRLKENISDMTDGIERVKQLQPKKFSFLSNPDKEIVDGFLAHEVKDLVPDSVIGEKDAVDDDGNPIMQTINVSALIPVLTAALKESIAKIETLETRLEALENA